MATKRLLTQSRKPLSQEQKVAFALLVFLGIGGVFFGFQSFGASLYHPIQLQFAKNFTGEMQKTDVQKESEEIEAQKTKDTDSDGLSDYDENFVYKTSPYLTDSDSDGIGDKTEVFGGTDPNCAQGSDCVAGVVNKENVSKSGTPPQDAFGGILSNEEMMKAGKVQFSSREDIEKFLKTATLNDVRTALVESGMKKEDVEKISDQDLEKYFSGAIDSVSKSGQFDSLISNPSTKTTEEINKQTKVQN